MTLPRYRYDIEWRIKMKNTKQVTGIIWIYSDGSSSYDEVDAPSPKEIGMIDALWLALKTNIINKVKFSPNQVED